MTWILRPALLCHGPALFVWHHLPTLCSLLQQLWTAAGRVASNKERGDTASQLQQDPWWIVKRACIFLNHPCIKSGERSYSYYLVSLHPHNLRNLHMASFLCIPRCWSWSFTVHYSPSEVVRIVLQELNLQQPSRKPTPVVHLAVKSSCESNVVGRFRIFMVRDLNIYCHSVIAFQEVKGTKWLYNCTSKAAKSWAWSLTDWLYFRTLEWFTFLRVSAGFCFCTT